MTATKEKLITWAEVMAYATCFSTVLVVLVYLFTMMNIWWTAEMTVIDAIVPCLECPTPEEIQ